MNAILSTINATHAAEEARRAQADAAAARQLAVLESGTARCRALTDEFNRTPLRLRYTKDLNGYDRHPELSPHRRTSNGGMISNNMQELIVAGLRPYLVWLPRGRLVASYNAERSFDHYCDRSQGPQGPELLKVVNEVRGSKALMTLEETQRCLERRIAAKLTITAEDADFCLVGVVMDTGRFTTDVQTCEPKRIFDSPADFIGTIVGFMAPWLEPVEEAPKKAKGKK